MYVKYRNCIYPKKSTEIVVCCEFIVSICIPKPTARLKVKYNFVPCGQVSDNHLPW